MADRRPSTGRGIHHVAFLAVSMAGIAYVVYSDVSLYFSDPDGVRMELIADPLGELYGTDVL